MMNQSVTYWNFLWIRGLNVGLREVGLETNLRKCEWTMINHTRDEALQTEVMFREYSAELKIVPISNSFL